jgi:DNA-binding NtrC family response regulator
MGQDHVCVTASRRPVASRAIGNYQSAAATDLPGQGSDQLQSAGGATQSRSRSRILLLEDNAALRGVLLELLADEALDVTLCTSLAELRLAVAAHPGAVVVTDSWYQTDSTVLSAEQRIDLIALGQSAPVIVTTARAWATVGEVGELGNVVILPKPYDLDRLMLLVRSALRLTSSPAGSERVGWSSPGNETRWRSPMASLPPHFSCRGRVVAD